MKKKLMICLVLVMALCLSFAPAAFAETSCTVSTWDELLKAVDYSNANPDTMVNVILAGDISGEETLDVYGKISVSGHGSINAKISVYGSLSLNSPDAALADVYITNVFDGGSFTMESGTVTSVTVGFWANDPAYFAMKGGNINAGVHVMEGARFEMSDGHITNPESIGVCNNGYFNMTGGSITDSYFGLDNTESGDATINGGLIYNNYSDISNLGKIELGKAAAGEELSRCGHEIDGWYEFRWEDIATGCTSGAAVQPGTYTGSLELIASHKPPVISSVPATADSSNMPLWSALFVALAAAALLTRKKKA